MPKWLVWMLVGGVATGAFLADVNVGRDAPVRASRTRETKNPS